MIRVEFVLAAVAAMSMAGGKSHSGQGDDVVADDQDTVQADEFINPFLNFGFQSDPQRSQVFLLTGHPGLGKTVWLSFILTLRLRAYLPTIFVQNSKIAYVFTEEGLFTVPVDHPDLDVISDHVPLSTWILVDSNRDLVASPQLLVDSGLFMVQSASPHTERISWINKRKYYMKPWTTGEIIAARMLQIAPPSEAAIELFCRDFAPSARSAYCYANSIAAYRQSIREKLTNLSGDILDILAMQAQGGGTVAESISHHFIVIDVPESRTVPEYRMPSALLYEMVEERIHTINNLSIARTFNLFLSSPFLKAAAGYIIDPRLGPIILGRAVWPVKSLTLSGDTTYDHWTTPEDPFSAIQFLVLGGDEIRLVNTEPGASTRTRTRTRTGDHDRQHRASGLQLFTFTPDTTISEHGYYQPDRITCPTFEGFLYDAKNKRAIVFQATVWRGHTVKQHSFAWLKEKGVSEIWYVAVTPKGQLCDFAVSPGVPHPTETLWVEVEESDLQKLSRAGEKRARS